MTDKELHKLAQYIVAEVREDKALLAQVIEMASAAQEKKLVSPKVAANMLGISVRQLRRIKDYFSYTKSGETKQSGLLFDASTLYREYDRYVASKKQPAPVRIIKLA